MGDKKKVVLPGDHLSSAMEYESGENTYIKDDEIYSAVVGEPAEVDKALTVKTNRSIPKPKVGMHVYCVVMRTTGTKAFVECIPVDCVDKGLHSTHISAVLPVTEIRRGHVRDLRDEVKTGDILHAKICKVTNDVDVSIFGPQFGVKIAFCSKCRSRMHLKEDSFICSKCHWRERRKIPGVERDNYRSDSRGGYRRTGRRPVSNHRSGRYGNRNFDQRKKHD